MKFTTLLFAFLFSIIGSCPNQQIVDGITTTIMTSDKFEFIYETAHSNAQKLMVESFLWSPIEETAPLGNDDGLDAAYGFRKWRQEYKEAKPLQYLDNLIERWNYEKLDYYTLDSTSIKEFLLSSKQIEESEILRKINQMKEIYRNTGDTLMVKITDADLREAVVESSKNMNSSFLLGQDNAIIGIAFAQLALEGRIEDEFKKITETAIKRQLLPILINNYDADYIEKRRAQLLVMLNIVR